MQWPLWNHPYRTLSNRTVFPVVSKKCGYRSLTGLLCRCSWMECCSCHSSLLWSLMHCWRGFTAFHQYSLEFSQSSLSSKAYSYSQLHFFRERNEFSSVEVCVGIITHLLAPENEDISNSVKTTALHNVFITVLHILSCSQNRFVHSRYGIWSHC